MKFSSINPKEMSNREVLSMCTELKTAQNWTLSHAKIEMESGATVDVSVNKLSEYQGHYQTETGGY